jgi:hypothetical protein
LNNPHQLLRDLENLDEQHHRLFKQRKQEEEDDLDRELDAILGELKDNDDRAMARFSEDLPRMANTRQNYGADEEAMKRMHEF